MPKDNDCAAVVQHHQHCWSWGATARLEPQQLEAQIALEQRVAERGPFLLVEVPVVEAAQVVAGRRGAVEGVLEAAPQRRHDDAGGLDGGGVGGRWGGHMHEALPFALQPRKGGHGEAVTGFKTGSDVRVDLLKISRSL